MVTTNSQRWKDKIPVRSGEERRAVVSGRLAGKSTKEETNYRPSMDEAKTGKSCASCTYYNKTGSFHSDCSKVAGIVDARDICDVYEGPGS